MQEKTMSQVVKAYKLIKQSNSFIPIDVLTNLITQAQAMQQLTHFTE